LIIARGVSNPIALLVVAALLGCGGCKQPPEGAPRPDGGSDVRSPGTAQSEAPLPLSENLFAYAGELDFESRYPSTVIVRTHDPLKAGVNGRCSGLLITPRLVLTAGHCVCVKQQATAPGDEDKALIDGSACARNPIVTTIEYDPPLEGMKVEPGSRSRSYKGAEVRPHPDLRILLDAQGQIIFSSGDLAVISLEQPAEGAFPAIPIAETEVHPGESIIMVSYTYDEVVGGIHGQRRFSRYKVSNIPKGNPGAVLFDQPGRQVYKGDSGGPCLRREARGEVLVGVSSRGLGEEATFTSIHPYRGWLEAEKARAATPPLHEPR
jgi:hypothetical protein